MGQISISRTVLKTSGCEDSENDLTFSIWPSFGWVIGLQSWHVKSAIFQDIGLDLTLITVLFAVRLAVRLLDNGNSIKLLYCVSEFFKQIFWEHDITWTTGPILMKFGYDDPEYLKNLWSNFYEIWISWPRISQELLVQFSWNLDMLTLNISRTTVSIFMKFGYVDPKYL